MRHLHFAKSTSCWQTICRDQLGYFPSFESSSNFAHILLNIYIIVHLGKRSMLLSSLLFRILMKFQSPPGVAYTVSYTNVTASLSKALLLWYWYRAATVDGDTECPRYRMPAIPTSYSSSSPVGGDANIMTAWMTVTARTTWIVIGLTSRYSTINTLGSLCSTSWPVLLDPLSPTSSPSQVIKIGPPGQQLDRVVGPLVKLPASGRR